jgi:osmotically-inducible protein OsmY
MLSNRGQVPDKRIVQKVQQRMSRLGLGAQTKVNVDVRNGAVILTGTLQLERQRKAVTQAARGVEGVRSIVDNMQIKAAAHKWQ